MKRIRVILAIAGLFVIGHSISVLFAEGPSVERNVVFGAYSGLALLMDVNKPATSNGYGVVVINGSGWHRELGYDSEMLKDSEGLRSAINKLVASGYTAFVINHRAAPGFHMQDAIDDAQRAVRFVRANARRYGIRADRIGAFGGSSGGHLVSMLGTVDGKGDAEASDPVERESGRVQCVVAFFPAVDLTTIDTPIGAGAVAAIMGMRPPTADLSQSSELSAQTFCTFPREFSSFRRKGRPGRATLIPNTILPVYSGAARSTFPGVASRRTVPDDRKAVSYR